MGLGIERTVGVSVSSPQLGQQPESGRCGLGCQMYRSDRSRLAVASVLSQLLPAHQYGTNMSRFPVGNDENVNSQVGSLVYLKAASQRSYELGSHSSGKSRCRVTKSPARFLPA